MEIQIDYEGRTYYFEKPITVLQTNKVEHVIETLHEVQDWQNKGYYAVGFVTYEASEALDPLYVTKTSNSSLPLIYFAIFESYKKSPHTEVTKNQKFTFSMDTDYSTFKSNIEIIKKEICSGNIYQANYTLRFTSKILGELSDLNTYKSMFRKSKVSYGAFINTPSHQIVSLSPELFFKITKNKIKTKPMKGTIVRGRTQDEDLNNYSFLKNDSKNKAENAMIVDLIRNDLGKISIPGSIKVADLFKVEKYPTVWQMTSTINAELMKKDLVSVFKALFPSGSITGAPKINAMKIIKKIEKGPRNIYCGTIGFLKPDGDMIFNIAIRTLLIDKQRKCSIYGSGGGIVYDSTVENEFKEVVYKAKVLTEYFPVIKLVECLKLENGKLLRMKQHLKRLVFSAEKLGFQLDINSVKKQWRKAIQKHSTGEYKFRYVIDNESKHEIYIDNIKEWPEILSAKLATKPIVVTKILSYKTNLRDHYEARRIDGFDETLLYNSKNELTEFINGNLVLEISKKMYTPFLDSGVLPGIMRELLINENKITERRLFVEDLANADKIYLINSVREFVEVKLI
ncbi:aminodeoxychorismate synthase component I [Enterococcus faecalis]|uniref:aminodeoxychorismate synthase component I n=1 Tax=Enterococcus faecalis TaxID=1351 RepID=UPI0015704F77|nr:aminodeoxychorismate synthase component I [Enterococcus faecalis]MCH1672746.1 aminodeoxychorismate synthase component I [Enterococcus faecalis]NSN01523.1 aminodeoxychorismate synthase component I [Enterococcus faecalis]